MKPNVIYLDAAAATPLDPLVLTAMQPYFSDQFFNASSAYKAARSVRGAYEEARHSLAQTLGAKPSEIIITAGATESVNLAIQGVMKAYPQAKIAISSIEHQAALETAKAFRHILIPVDQNGVVSPEFLTKTIDDTTVLVSIGFVNSEIGVKQPLRKLVQAVETIRKDRQARGIDLPLYFHTDASQAAGMLDMHVSRLGVDLLTLGASKIYGPKQVGLLYAKHTVQLQPLIYGGGQEGGVRSGTENVAGVIGFAKALKLAQDNREARSYHIQNLRDRFESAIKKQLPQAQITAEKAHRSPHISHITIPGIDAETLLFMLDEQGVMVATGAACAANKATASHVLQVIGCSVEATQGSIRCSFMHTLTEVDIDAASDILVQCARKLLEPDSQALSKPSLFPSVTKRVAYERRGVEEGLESQVQ